MRDFRKIIVYLIGLTAITGIGFIDNYIWGAFFSITSVFAYSIVGILFAIGLIRTRGEGSKAYNLLFIVIVIYVGNGIISISNKVESLELQIFEEIKKLEKYTWIILLVILIAIIIMVIKLIINKQVADEINIEQQKSIEENDNICINTEKEDIVNEKISIPKKEEQCYSLKELWEITKTIPLTAYRVDYSNLEYIKLYHDPDKYNGKYFGYIKMLNRKKEFNSEIFYPNKKIWRLKE